MWKKSLRRFWLSARSWMRDKRVDDVFIGTRRSAAFVGVHYVKVIHVDPGKKAVIDVMLASGERMQAPVFHGAPKDRTVASALDEVEQYRRSNRSPQDIDPKLVFPDLLSSMTAPDGTIDLSMKPGNGWLKTLLRKKLHDRMKSTIAGVWEYDAAMEAVNRYFSEVEK